MDLTGFRMLLRSFVSSEDGLDDPVISPKLTGAGSLASFSRTSASSPDLPFWKKPLIAWSVMLIRSCNRGLIIVAFLLTWVIASIPASAQGNTVSGFVEVEATGVRVVGAHVFLEDTPSRGVITNQDGYFSLATASKEFALVVSHVSYMQLRVELEVVGDTTMVFQIVPAMIMLEGVEVQDTRIVDEGARMSTHHIPIAAVEALPALAGEVDIQKTLQLMPGVQGGAEGSAGLYVRGGRHDQNLILLDGMPLYNPTHLFGFLSVFHTAAIKDVEFVKGGFPARYGGRLSSVVNYSMKEGSLQEFHGQGTIGLVASNLAFEGPLIRNRASIMVAARRSYVDAIIWPFQSEKQRSGFNFYDVSAKANVRLSNKDNVSLSIYGGRDKLYSRYDNAPGASDYTDLGRLGIGWANRTAALRWGRVLNSRIYLTASAGIVQYERESTYSYEFASTEDAGIRTGEARQTNIRDYVGRIELDYVATSLLSLRAGLETIRHKIDPSRETLTYARTDSLRSAQSFEGGEIFTAGTFAAYMESDWRLRSGISMNIGLRASSYRNGTLQDLDLSPRVSVSVPILEDFSATASWARMSQFLHQPISSATDLPSELWIPSLQGLPSQRGHQLAAGFRGRLLRQRFTASIEAFDKRMRGLPEYGRHGEYGSLPPIDWPNVLTSGRGRAWGVEFFLRKEVGSPKGWLAYTYSRATRWFADIDRGEPFPDTFDRRHDISVALTHELSSRVHLAATWVFGSGYPATLPAGEYVANTFYEFYNVTSTNPPPKVLVDYGPTNGSRLPPTHRLDLSLRLHKQFKRSKRTWTFGVHNAYNRRNPSYVFPVLSNGHRPVRIKQISYLMLIPTISYSRAF